MQRMTSGLNVPPHAVVVVWFSCKSFLYINPFFLSWPSLKSQQAWILVWAPLSQLCTCYILTSHVLILISFLLRMDFPFSKFCSEYKLEIYCPSGLFYCPTVLETKPVGKVLVLLHARKLRCEFWLLLKEIFLTWGILLTWLVTAAYQICRAAGCIFHAVRHQTGGFEWTLEVTNEIVTDPPCCRFKCWLSSVPLPLMCCVFNLYVSLILI